MSSWALTVVLLCASVLCFCVCPTCGAVAGSTAVLVRPTTAASCWPSRCLCWRPCTGSDWFCAACVLSRARRRLCSTAPGSTLSPSTHLYFSPRPQHVWRVMRWVTRHRKHHQIRDRTRRNVMRWDDMSGRLGHRSGGGITWLWIRCREIWLKNNVME